MRSPWMEKGKTMSDHSQSNRNMWYDNAKAILIVFVVIGHLATSTLSPHREWVNSVAKYIYFFHMPVFMIISGRFCRGRVDRREYGKPVVQLLIPYLILQTGMILLHYVMDAKQSNFSYLSPLFGLWYLFALFLYSVSTPSLLKQRFLMGISLVAATCVAFFPIPLYGGFHRVVTYYPFFLFGYYTASQEFRFCRKVWFRLLSFAVMVGLFAFTMRYGTSIRTYLFTLDTVICDINGDNRLLITAEYLLHYAVSFLMFFIIMGISPTRKTFFSHLGVYSIYPYALHLFFIVWLRNVADGVPISTRSAAIVYLLAGIPLTFLLASKPVRRLFRPLVEPKVNLGRVLKALAGEEITR